MDERLTFIETIHCRDAEYQFEGTRGSNLFAFATPSKKLFLFSTSSESPPVLLLILILK